jgi:AcrR family transcriptional regulator
MSVLLNLAIRLGNVYSDNMTSNANSVNIESEKRGYHHGDLRSALVQAGLDVLKTRAPDAVSLREIARMAGVSATAVYRHFPDKQALLSALCNEGGAELARLQQAAMEQAGGGVAGFDAVGRAYVRFALANPTLFRLMMTAPVDPCDDDETLAQDVFAKKILMENIAALAPANASPASQRVFALRAWSIVHGLAMLMLDGQVPAEDALIDAIITSAAVGVGQD